MSMRTPPRKSTDLHRAVRRTLASLVLCLAPICAGSSAAQPSPTAAPQAKADQLVSTVQALYDRSGTFKSDFEQKFWVKAYDTEKSSHGHVTFSKPGKMNWTYDDPQGNRIVSDGSLVRIYEAANKQM